MLEDELMHYGVKGMKWGHRKQSPTTSGKKTKRQKKKNIKKQIKAVKKSRREASKRRVLLSDKELDSRIDRLAREKRLKELTDEQISPGRTYVRETLKRTGSQAISSSVNIGESVVRKQLGLSGNKKKKAS